MTDAPQNSPASSPDSTESLAETQKRLAVEGGVNSAEAPPAAQPSNHDAPAAQAHTGDAFRKRPVALGLVAALAVGALVGGVSGAGVTYWVTSANSSNPTVTGSSPTSITVNDAQDATQVTAVAAKASPSVVTISVSASEGAGTGSGVILSTDGYVLTNTHVVTLDGSVSDPTVTVTTNDGRLLTATVVGTDPISDLAVIKIDGVTDLQPADFADSSQLNVGDTAIAIGAPLGLAGTVTNGIVSALNRSITVASSAVPEESDTEQAPQQDQGETPFDFWNFDLPGQDATATPSTSSTISLSVIQTDAAINPGNSGGALLDGDGNVIGINVAIASAGGTSSSSQAGSIGVGFAIPSNLAQRIAQEIIDTGSATHGLLGASVADVTEDTAQADSKVVGASIVELSDGGAASAAGLKVGDIVTQVDGIPITGKTDLTAQIRSLAAGATATITYVRGGTPGTVEVTLGTLE